MRTKHLLTAMVLPALFAACTNDDFQSAAPEAPVNADGRNVVENVKLNLGGVDTRLAYDGSNDEYTWEAGDQIGACLMDEINTNDTDGDGTIDYNEKEIWRNRFNLVDYIQTNYKFTRDDAGDWTTEAKMLEGNYFFAYPYNANNGVRNAYTFTAKDQVMEGTTDADLQKAFVENNSFIGYGKVEKGASEGETVGVRMVRVFGATGITIGTTGTQTYTIERVVLRGTKVSTEATVDPLTCTTSKQYNSNALNYSNTTTYPNGGAGVTYNTVFNVAQYTKDSEDMYVQGVSAGDYVSNWSAYNANNALRDVLDYKPGVVESGAEVILEGGNVINANTSINVIVMVAPEDLGTTDDEAVLDIYTDKGIIRDIQLNHRYSANDQTGTTTNILTDVALTSVGTGNKVEVTFDDTSVDVPASMAIYSNEDLANLIHWNAGIAATLTATLETNVTLSKAMYDELAKSQIQSLTIEGSSNTVTIAKDVADGALNKIKYDDIKGVTVAGGTQSLSSNITSPLTINSGATVNVTKEITPKAVTNKGTLNVNGKVKGSALITNLAKMTVSKEIIAPVTNGNVASVAMGTITNTGTIRALTNAYGVVTNNGSIGTTSAKTSTNSAYGEITNNGKVYMAINAGVIYANGVSATDVNENNGSIVITDLDSDGNFKTGTAKGAIVQEITANANTDAVDTRANTVWLSAVLSVEKTNKDGYVKVDLSGISLIATSKAARINGHQAGLTLNSIQVNDAAAMVLSNEKVEVVDADVFVGMNATLTVNSNASLKDDNNNVITTVSGTGTYENYSQLD